MRRYLSILMLMARKTIYKILLISAGLAAAQGLIFFKLLSSSAPSANGGNVMQRLDILISDHKSIIIVFGIAFVLITGALVFTACDFGSKQSYTYERLSVSKKGVFLLQSMYNLACYLILWGIQLIILILMCVIYVKRQDPAAINSQTLFLAFFRNRFMHNIMPLGDFPVFLRNIVLASGLGFSSALFSYKQRLGQFDIGIVFLTVLTLVFFNAFSLGDQGGNLVLGTASLILILIALNRIYGKDKADETAKADKP